MVEEAKHSVPDEVGRRFGAGEKQQLEKRKDLVFRQSFTIHFRFGEARQQIVARRHAPLGKERAKIRLAAVDHGVEQIWGERGDARRCAAPGSRRRAA
jgi:hypothetical protein